MVTMITMINESMTMITMIMKTMINDDNNN